MRGWYVSVVLLGLGWLALGLGLWADGRRGSPEPALRQYLEDLQNHRLAEASAAIEPGERQRWDDFLDFQQFNHYTVVSIAVRSPSLLDVATHGGGWRADEATLVADIVEPSGVRWRGSTVVGLRYADGRWYLERPPFAP
jgi:hypothetical protein